MRQIIVKLGHAQSVLAITVFSCLASVLITLLILYCYAWLDIDLNILSNIIIAALVPLVLAPPISWFVIGLLLKIDQLEIEMRNMATYDPLTGLFNRHAFMERANYVFDLAVRDGLDISVLLVDLDHFKGVNDKFGHASGDKVLATFGEVVTNLIRKSDIVGRWGGEEFVFLLPNTSEDQAWLFSKRLHEAVNNTVFYHDKREIRITMSIGVVTLLKGTITSIENALGMADKAMYHAKENGRNQSATYSER